MAYWISSGYRSPKEERKFEVPKIQKKKGKGTG
jgi:hypothetical protein